MATEDDLELGPKLFTNIVGERQTFLSDSWKLHNYALAAADSTIRSVGYLGSLGNWDPDSIFPKSWETYQRSRAGYETVAAIPLLFTSFGAGTKASRVLGGAEKIARSFDEVVASKPSTWLKVPGIAGDKLGTAVGGALKTSSHISGPTEKMAQRLGSTMMRIEETEKLYGDMVAATAQTAGAALARGGYTPAKTATVGDALKYAGNTVGEVEAYIKSGRLANGIREGLAQEAATFALMNQNEFLFPENATLGDYALAAGLGVGINTAVEHVIGAAIMRRARQAAGRIGAETAAANKRRTLTETSTLQGVIGEQWQGAAAAIYGTERARALDWQSVQLAASAGNMVSPEALREIAGQATLEFKSTFDRAIKSMFANSVQGEAFQKGFGNVKGSKISTSITDNTVQFTPYLRRGSAGNMAPVMEAMFERSKKNINAIVGVAELADPGIAARFKFTRDLNEGALFAAKKAEAKATDPKELAAARAEVQRLQGVIAEIDNYRAATIEQTAVPNYNPNRMPPAWENPEVRAASLSNMGTPDGVYLNTPARGDKRLILDYEGRVAYHNNKEISIKGQRVAGSRLDYDEATLLFTQVSKLAKEDNVAARSWRGHFWDNVVKNADFDFRELPYQVLDAIHAGLLKVPDSLKTHPNVSKIQSAISTGQIQAASMGQKLDWMRTAKFREAQSGVELDVFDVEKALNLRLTDDLGRPTVMWDALTAFGMQDSTLGATFMARGNYVNDAWNDLFELGAGWGTRFSGAQLDVQRQFFDEGLNGVDAFGAVDKVGGIGALYHATELPTDSQMALVSALETRNRAREVGLLSSTNGLVAGLSNEIRRVGPAWEGVKQVESLVADLATRGPNYLTTTTFAQRFATVNQHAHAIGQQAQKWIDQHKTVMLKATAEFAQTLRRTNQHVLPFANVSNTRELISRGFALKEEFYKVGRNEIDVSRPGAKMMLEYFGDLKNAPAPGQTWELFDMTVAAREGRYVPIDLDEGAVRILNGLVESQYDQLGAMNATRTAQGKGLINKKHGSLPMTDARRFDYAYVQDPETGKIVGWVKGATEKEAMDAALEAVAELNKRRDPEKMSLIAADQQAVKDYYDSIDGMFLSHMQNFSGIRNSGTSGGKNVRFELDVSADPIEEMLQSARNNYDDMKNRILAANLSSTFAAVDSVQRRLRTGLGKSAEKTFWNEADQWQNLLFASSRLAPESQSKRGHKFAESAINSALEKGGEWKDRLYGAAYQLVTGATQPGAKSYSQAELKAAQEMIDKYPPFAAMSMPDVLEAAKLTERADAFKLHKTLQIMNRTAVRLGLGHMNVFTPMMNVLGIAATLPAVNAAVRQMPGETINAWKTRVGPLADLLGDNGAATVSPVKLGMDGIHLLNNDAAARGYAKANGYLNGNFIEELDEVIAIKPNNFFEAIDKSFKWMDIINRGINKGRQTLGKSVAGEPFTLYERSEEWTRGVAHMAGVALARRSGQMDEAAQHAFGNYLANQMIADFAPNIRGEVFRGVVGTPFGLFQSFAINILQRSFTYIEDRNKRAFVTQMLTQGLMFGANGVPGWPALNALFFDQSDARADERGATSLNERLQANLGPVTSNLILNGSLSTLPMLLGSDSGLNTYTSGDMNPRFSAIPPAFSMANQAVQGAYAAVKVAADEASKLTDARGSDPKRFVEVVSNYSVSRGVRSIADLVLGEKVDRNGNLLVEDTRSGVALISRLMGTKTSNEEMLGRAIWQNSMAGQQMNDSMARLRSSMLRELREYDGRLPDDVKAAYYAQYLNKGGRADTWTQWLKGTVKKATETRGEIRLDELVHEGQVWPKNLAAVGRLLAAGVDPETVN